MSAAWVGKEPARELASRVAAALSAIADPCLAAAGIPGSITDLGLVQDVRADADGRVAVDISLTEMGCAFTHHLLDAVWTAVEGVEGVLAATVTPTWTWSPEQIRPPLATAIRERAEALPDQLGMQAVPAHRRLPVLTGTPP